MKQKHIVYGEGGFNPELPNNNIIDEYETDAVVPAIISMRQCRLGLLQRGWLADVEALMDATNNIAAKIEWEYATEVRRDHPLVAEIALQLNLSEQDIDELFVTSEFL
jgi:hypothetical protein